LSIVYGTAAATVITNGSGEVGSNGGLEPGMFFPSYTTQLGAFNNFRIMRVKMSFMPTGSGNYYGALALAFRKQSSISPDYTMTGMLQNERSIMGNVSTINQLSWMPSEPKEKQYYTSTQWAGFPIGVYDISVRNGSATSTVGYIIFEGELSCRQD